MEIDRYRDRGPAYPPDRFGPPPRYDWPGYDDRRFDAGYDRMPRPRSPPRRMSPEDDRPSVGSTVPAGVTSIKGHLGLFVEINTPRGGKLSGLIHLSEISPEFEEVQRRVRNSGRTDRAAFDAVERLLERHFKVGQPVRPRVVKYKKDRGMSVVDLTLLNTVDEPKGVDAVNFGLPETAADGAAKAAAAAAAADAPSAAPTAEGADSKPGSNSGAHPAVNGQEGAQEGSNTGTNTRIEAGSGNGSGNGKSPDSAPPKERTGGSGANGGTGQSGAGHGSALTRPRTIDKKEGKMEGRKHGAKIPDIHTVHKVSIIKAFHDGIFVSIPGYDVDGLVHHSQISRNLMLPADMPKAERYHKINDLIGDIDYDVYAKTVYVCDEKDYTKCECSLKMVSQRDGRDLDPDHKMWFDYMVKRRARGAGTYTAPKMREELKHVAYQLGEPLPNMGPDEGRPSRTGGDRRGDHRGGPHSGPSHRNDGPRYTAPAREPEPYHEPPYRAGPRNAPDGPPYEDPRYGPPAHYDAPHHSAYDAPPRDAYYGRPYSAGSEYSGYGERPRTHDGYAPPARDPYYDRPPRDAPAPAAGGYSYGGGSGYGGAPDPYARERPASASMHPPAGGRPAPRLDDYDRPAAPAQPESQYASMHMPPPDIPAGGDPYARRQASPHDAYHRRDFAPRMEAASSPHVELGDDGRRAAERYAQPMPAAAAPWPAAEPAPVASMPAGTTAAQVAASMPGMSQDAIQAMINQMVNQQTEAKVAEVLAEERRKRKLRNKDREASEETRKRRHRRSTESR